MLQVELDVRVSAAERDRTVVRAEELYADDKDQVGSSAHEANIVCDVWLLCGGRGRRRGGLLETEVVVVVVVVVVKEEEEVILNEVEYEMEE